MTSMKVFLALAAIVATAHAQFTTTTSTSTTTQTTTVTQTWVTVTQTYCPAIYRLIIQSPATVTLLSTTTNYTILCPSNQALSVAKVPDYLTVQNLLSYHVLFGIVSAKQIETGTTLVTAYQGKRLSYRREERGRVEINGDKSYASVVKGDIPIKNGYVHVINTVLIPTKPVCGTIYGSIVANSDLSTLKSVIDAAGVAAYLEDSGLVGTVFCPTNKAFDQLFKALRTDVKTVLKNKELLITILSNHVVPGKAVRSTQLRNGQRFTTLLKSSLQIGVGRRTVTVRSYGSKSFAIVKRANIASCKAFVHVIDQVLVPIVKAKKHVKIVTVKKSHWHGL